MILWGSECWTMTASSQGQSGPAQGCGLSCPSEGDRTQSYISQEIHFFFYFQLRNYLQPGYQFDIHLIQTFKGNNQNLQVRADLQSTDLLRNSKICHHFGNTCKVLHPLCHHQTRQSQQSRLKFKKLQLYIYQYINGQQ